MIAAQARNGIGPADLNQLSLAVIVAYFSSKASIVPRASEVKSQLIARFDGITESHRGSRLVFARRDRLRFVTQYR
jgi:hypothetical protein